MNETGFRNWLGAQGHLPSSISTRLSDLRRIAKHFGDLDEAFRTDKFAAILSKLAYTSADRDAGKVNESGLKIDGDVYESLSTFRSCLALYARFKGEEDMAFEPKSQADRIRRFVLERYAEPARQRGESAFTVRVGDVHRDMGLSNAMPAVCSALDSEKFLRLANVSRTSREGPANSSTVQFTFSFAGRTALDRDALQRYRRNFLNRYPDFEPDAFAKSEGGYFAEERAYKDELLIRARRAREDVANDPDALGGRLLDILAGLAGTKSGLLGWRTDGHLAKLRKEHPGALEREAGRFALAQPSVEAVTAFAGAIWPLLSEDQPSKPYSESRNIPSMLAALLYPNEMYGINTEPVSRTVNALTGKRAFGMNPLTAQEYRDVLELAATLRVIMEKEWGWSPRDLWDVQGFIWAVNRDEQPKTDEAGTPTRETGQQENADKTMVERATNLILYGPPGTGKTYQTAYEAVRLCNGSVPEERDEVMKEYSRLVDSGRIEFVTFHQSFSYEEFVEGLRPSPLDNGNGGGFQLRPEPGTFRQIAERAEAASGLRDLDFSLEDRQVFKMSIGEAANRDDDHLFEEALNGGYTLLGYGDIDWTDAEFERQDAMIEAYRERMPGRPTPTAGHARVQCPFIFRNLMNEGDIIVVSKGNSRFRAIGVVTGGYEYAPRPERGYAHRRAVRWLWHDREGVPVENIYARGFTMRALYPLKADDVNLPALQRYIGGRREDSRSEPEQFVLVIDEINRANISKVFGELITLIEPDKRIGAENELKVRLPYSRAMFGVPANLHIIGTMNTADRSIALLDTALRRRFEFRELMPDASRLRSASEQTGVNLEKLLSVINERIEYLFDREHQIGHAYFMPCQTRQDVDSVMRSKVIPLLAEYFYEDWSKVALVLGDGNGAGRFIERTALRAPNGLDADTAGNDRFRWTVREVFAEDAYDQFT